MNRLAIPMIITGLALLGACNVTDNGNGSSTISIDQNKIDQGANALANEASEAGDQAANAIENAGPEIKKSANDIQERASRVADKASNIDVDVDLNKADDKPAVTPPAKK